MAKETFTCPICGKASDSGYDLADGKICSDCETLAEDFLSGLDGGDEYLPEEMTVDIIKNYIKMVVFRSMMKLRYIMLATSPRLLLIMFSMIAKNIRLWDRA